MATDLGIRIKTTFDNKGINAIRKALDAIKKAGGQAANKLKQSFAGMEDSVKSTGKEVIKNLGPAALLGPAAAIGALATGMGVLARDTLKAAEESKKVTSAFTNLSGGAMIATANLQAMRNATKGLVSETEQMAIANQLLGMQIVQTADQLEEVVGVSRRLGKEFRGLGARDAAEEFAIMIANMSVARLDSFGLSSGRVRKRINELMKETQGMTREAAFFQATMEEGQKTLERLGPEITTSAEEMSILSAEWANFKVVMGQTAEEAGIVKNIIKGFSDDLIKLTAFFDDTPESRMKSLKIQVSELEMELATLSEKEQKGGFFGFVSTALMPRTKKILAEVRKELDAVTIAVNENILAGKKQQEILQDRIRSEELAIESLEKQAESEKKFLQTQEQFAKEVISIQAETAEGLADSQANFDKDRLKNAEDNLKKLDSIRDKARKADIKADAKLSKDKAKINTNLGKALIKNQLNENKRISKTKDDFEKQDKTERKRKRIDAVGDERLFQLDLRNLAADGEGIAIKEALERRAIEQQIASEKAEFEKEVEQDKRKEQIASIKGEGVDRRAELKQQAQERKDDLQERNNEATQVRTERLAEEILKENESFTQKQADLSEALTERNEAIREGEKDRIQEIAKGLTEVEELTGAQLDRMIELARQFGPEFGEVFATGMTEAFTENLKIESAVKKVAQITKEGASRSLTTIGAGGGAGAGGPARIGGIQELQGGGILSSDGVFFGHQGEEVANPSEGQAISIGNETFAVREAERMVNAINSMRQRDMQELVDVVAGSL